MLNHLVLGHTSPGATVEVRVDNSLRLIAELDGRNPDAAIVRRVDLVKRFTGAVFWASSTIFGIGIVFAIFPWLAVGGWLAGATYLIWFGLRLIVFARAGDQAAPRTQSVPLLRTTFLRGGATNIANPKPIAFNAAVFSSAALTHVSQTFLAMLATVGVSETFWYGSVAIVLSHARSRQRIVARKPRSTAYVEVL